MTATLTPALAERIRVGTVVPYPGGHRPVDFVNDVASRVRGGYSPGGSNVRAMVVRALHLLAEGERDERERDEVLRAAGLIERNQPLDQPAAVVVARCMDEVAIVLRDSEPLEYLSDAGERLVRSGAAASTAEARTLLEHLPQVGPGLVETREVDAVLHSAHPAS